MQVSFVVVRAALALLFAIGFYVLALGIAFGLLWLPYAELAYAHHVTPKLDIICILGGLAILWSAAATGQIQRARPAFAAEEATEVVRRAGAGR